MAASSTSPSPGWSTGSEGDVDLYLGNGDGTFKTALNDAIGGLPVAIVVADYNRDGIPGFRHHRLLRQHRFGLAR